MQVAVTLIFALALGAQAHEWRPDIPILRVESIGQHPPMDKDGNVSPQFQEKIIYEWVVWRAREYCEFKKHVPPKEYNYGNTWRSLRAGWKEAFESMSLQYWEKEMKSGRVQYAYLCRVERY